MSSGGSPAAAAHHGGMFGSSGISGFGYGVGVSIGILLIVSTVALAVYFCTRTSMPGTTGIDEATLAAFPAAPYAEARRKQAGRDAEQACCCPVCLETYADADVVRVLPDCAHVFHRACVDPWLRLRPTCPVCRTSPLPSPLPTPLAEVTPLAAAAATRSS
ncbi:hypothetical protein PR202_gb12290 [Eleusine coracana subsp. coracana]|uniref:RING-type domain-containing protein n=1 Tax=Eleusine coracana subsp. coracana TaxID=191504 RepID=A0AAV5EPV1_ELECO|nr:hypothetical protein PR202_gb12290 [Eleusine coracana subsp. coracana]